MSGLTTIALASATPQAWRNGGGSTRELFTWPDAANWWVRISVAEIGQDGPFSAYDGVDRWFAVLHGAGVRLALPSGPVTLRPGSDPQAFAGEAAPGCALLGGPTQDLNLMLRRAAGQGRMRRVAPGQRWTSTAPLRALFGTEPLRLHVGNAAGQPLSTHTLPADTLAVSTQASGQVWSVSACGPAPLAWWIEFEPTPPSTSTSMPARR